MTDDEKHICKFSMEVYEDHAIITGMLTSDILIMLTRFCKKYGFTHMTHNGNKPGFKLIRGDKDNG